VVVNAEPTKANKTTPGSERQSLLKNDLTGPTLLEMSDKRGLSGHLPRNQFHFSTTRFYPACAI